MKHFFLTTNFLNTLTLTLGKEFKPGFKNLNQCLILIVGLFALFPCFTLAQNPQMVKDINNSGSSYLTELTAYNGSLYFQADDGTNGYELRKYAIEWTGSSSASWSNASNWEWEEPGDTVSAYIPKGLSTYPNVTSDQKVHNLTLQSDNTTPGEIDVQSGNTVTVKGDIINNGQSDLGNGTIKLNNTNDSQTIRGSSKTIVDNLTIDNSNDINLESNVEIQSTLTLTNGVLDIPSGNDSIILNDGISVSPSGGSSSSYVQGKVTKVGDDAFTFPLGDNGQWARLAISDPGSNTSVKFTASYNNNGYGKTSTGANLINVSTNEYWKLNEVSSNAPSVKVILHWESGSAQGINSKSDLRVAHWNASQTQWESKGNNSNSGNASGSGSITSSSMSSFSPFTFGASNSSNNPLPVELLRFEAEKLHDRVKLKWSTASETQNSHFLVQRRTNTTWQTIGKVSGHGNTVKQHRYQFTDPDPAQGYQYYRLKQVDYDGSFVYSNIRQVNYNQAINSGIRVLSNPVRDKLAVRIQSPGEDHPYEVTLTSIYGRKVYREVWTLEKGHNNRQIAVSQLNAGQYLLLVESRGTVYKKKIVKY